MTMSKQDKFSNLFALYSCVKTRSPFKPGPKDGSLPTRPVVAVFSLPEAVILRQVLDWLTSRRIFHRRMNVGKGSLDGKRYYQYGVVGAGDIYGVLPDGTHFELEIKAGKGGRWSKKQQEYAADLSTTKAYYFIIHGIEELKYYFQELI